MTSSSRSSFVRQCRIFQQAMIGEVIHRLRQLFQIERSCPTRIPGSFAFLQLCLNVHQQIDPFRLLVNLFFLARRVPLLTFDNREQHIFRIIFSQGVQPDRTAPALAAERGIFTGLDFITGLLQQLQQSTPIRRLLR